MRILILREGTHLGGNFGSVVADHVGEDHSIGNAVGQVMVSAQLVSHGVVHAQEGVGESHTGHAGGLGHALAGVGIVGAVLIGGRQVIKHSLHGLQSQAIGKGSGHDGHIRLDGMGHNVDTGCRGQALGLSHHVVGVHDSHGGQQLVVSQRPLGAGLLIGDDGEGSHFGTSTGRGGDSNHDCLLAHLGELVDTLPDIHEVHAHGLEVGIGMLVQHPHDLGSVHGRTAAQSDDHVGLEVADLLHALHSAAQGGIGSNVVEASVLDAQLVQLIGDVLGEATLEQEGVGDDKRLLAVVFGLQLVESHRHAALLKVNLLRRSEPQHILSPLGNGLDVDQVLDTHVLRDGVAAPRTAAQSKGGSQFEVVQVADTALRRGGVHQNTAGLHGSLMLGHLFLLSHIDIQRRSVAVTAVSNQMLSLVNGLVEGLGMVHGQHGRQLLVSELFGDVHALHFANEDLGVLRHIHTGHGGDGVSALANDLGVDGAVDDNGLADLFRLFFVEEVAAALLELILHSLVNLIQNDHGLLGSADHAVIEGLGMDDGVDSQHHIGGVVDDGGGVAGAHAQSGSTGGVSSLHHAGATGGQDDVGLGHQGVGQLQVGNVDPADQALGSASLHSGLQNDFRSRDGALLGTGMGADDDAVAGLQRDQSLKDGGGSGVGGGDNSTDHADGLSDLLDAVSLVFLDHAAGLGVLVGVIDVLSSIVVLDDLVFHHAHAGLLHSHFGQRDTLEVGSHGGGAEDFVHLLLGVGGEHLLRLAHPGKHSFECLRVLHNFVSHFRVHEILHPFFKLFCAESFL